MERIKLLGINGSPRRRGNSQFLLDEAVKEASTAGAGFVDVESYCLGGKRIAPCNSCFVCAEQGDCCIRDDFQELRDKWAQADAILYSIPVYHMNIPGKLRCFIDRLGSSLWAWYGGGPSKSLKVIGSIAQGAHIFSGQEHAITCLVNHALVMGCVPVSGDLWESYIGAGGWTRCSEARDGLRTLLQEGDPDAEVTLRAARSLARRVVHLALLIKTGGRHCRDVLERDGGYQQFISRLP